MLLLLDIDGVMVPGNSWRRPEILEDGFSAFSTQATKALNLLISATDGKIVLTTSHKFRFSISEWYNIFERRNIKAKHVSRLSEKVDYRTRKDEILAWFNANSHIDNFLIIDDDKSLNELPAALKERLIQTSASVGLTEYLVEEALENMNKQHPLLI